MRFMGSRSGHSIDVGTRFLGFAISRVQIAATSQALFAGYASQGIKRTAGSHPSEAYPADKAEMLANRFDRRTYWISEVNAGSHGRMPDTLTLGWLCAVRFIRKVSVSGVLPQSVELRSPFSIW